MNFCRSSVGLSSPRLPCCPLLLRAQHFRDENAERPRGRRRCARARAQSAGSGTTVGRRGRIRLETLGGCALGIGRFPDFQYNGEGGAGEGVAEEEPSPVGSDRVSLQFDPCSLRIPPLDCETTRLFGLPLPPFVRVRIVPEELQGVLQRETGVVELDLAARFLLEVGRVYRPPALAVRTRLTTEVARGQRRSGMGRRMDKEGRCRLVGVATVVPTEDGLLNAFLGLPTECLADLSAKILLTYL
eukprot:TRINITY_DN17379_c0_g1_i1.p2 TRINITY_DN17379_c0_g1~~TRINITY_DN17379_c0_g1_i1.p2  ORF type:complete len:244 (+),score=-20.09 TRINITY_DN17379_c0_g1_i1:313-1044(+)